MNALLDASFVRHLEYAGALALVPAFRARLGWEFIVPEAVLSELARLRVPQEIESFLRDGTASIGRCDVSRTDLPMERLDGLGRGETEAICIVGECEDRAFKKYVILTDDRTAQSRAGALGMGSLDSAEFVLMANTEGLWPAGRAMSALEAIEASGYDVGEDVRADFVRRLA